MRERFIKLAEEGRLPFAQVCARFGISRKTGYKWLNRFRAEGPSGLLERDRVPRSHPHRTAPEIERRVAEFLSMHPEWTNGRLRRELESEGVNPVPAITTIDAIRRRQAAVESKGRAAPNDGWILEIGPVTVSGGLNHRAYVLRDRATGFVLVADVLAERGEEGCREVVWKAFERHGLPRRLLWPSSVKEDPAKEKSAQKYTSLMVDILKVGVAVEFGSVELPPTGDALWAGLQAKLKGLPAGNDFGALLHRHAVDSEDEPPPLARPPHEVLVRWRGRLMEWADRQNGPRARGEEGRRSVSARYRPSPRRLSQPVQTVAPAGTVSRRVSDKGGFYFEGRQWSIGRAFTGESVDLCPLARSGKVTVYFYGHPVGVLTEGEADSDESSTMQPVRALESV